MPTKDATEQENQALFQTLKQFSERPVRDDFSSLVEYLKRYPDSAWAPALEVQLGREYYRVGRYSKAISAWKHVWESQKPGTSGTSSVLVNEAGSELGMMYARLGRMPELRLLLNKLQGQPEHGKLTRQIHGATDGLWSMDHKPEVSFRCGPLALDRILFATDRAKAGSPLIENSQSTTNGFSVRQVSDLSRQLGMNYQVAFRTPGSEIILPAVVHWKVGHYAALIARDGSLLRAEDPTFGTYKIWLSDDALDDEASGYFLVPAGPLPPGWRTVSDAEAGQVWGKGSTVGSNPDFDSYYDYENKVCKDPHADYNTMTSHGGPVPGMATWSVRLMLASLHLEDTPVSYQPPVGPRIDFTVSYNSADDQNRQSVPYSNVAPEWQINWLQYIIDDPMNSAGDVRFEGMGGGLTFTDFNPTNQVFRNQYRNRSDLVRTGTNSYEMNYPDGSKRIFDLPDGSVGTTRRIYMTALVDPAGNAATVQYGFPGKITSITDAIGQKTILHYDFNYTLTIPAPGDPNPPSFPENNPLIVTSVVDPFGRVAKFQINSTTNYSCAINVNPTCSWPAWAVLTNIVDSIGMSSSFVASTPPPPEYTNTGWRVLETPYGQTWFSSGSFTGLYRANWIEILHPNGEKERVEYSEKTPAQIFSSEPLSIVPKGVPVRNFILWARNTYYWDRKAYAEGYSPNDYRGARIYHWTHSPDYTTSSGILESCKEPLEHRVWFSYDGQVNPTFLGTSDQPTSIARTLEDGTTQIYRYEYNSLNNPTKAIDPMGREVTFTYETNDMDLKEIRQTRAGNNELLFSATYNSQHRPLTVTDASGQTERFSYNARGQALSITNALGEVTLFTYDTNGYLLAMDGALPGTNDTSHFSFDNVGRLRTASDLDGYTLTFDYDNLDRLVKITYPDSTYEQIVYNRLDPAVFRDRAGRETQLTFDSLRQLTSVQDPLGRISHYNWCGCGSIGSIIDPLGRTTSWIRDLEGRVQTKVYPDGSKIQYEYDTATGWLKTIRDEQNQVTRLDYNLDGTLQQKRYQNALIATPTVKFTYDSNYRRVLTMEDGTGVTSYIYNPVTGSPLLGSGRLASIGGPLPNDTITFQYDELGRAAKCNVNGDILSRTWDAAGRMLQFSNNLGSFTNEWDGYSYRVSAINYPNGQRSTYSYFPNLKDQLLNQITHLKPGGGLLSRFTYDYNVVRQISDWTQERSGANPIAYHFDYDAVDQLTNAVATQNSSTVFTGSYLYDGGENLTGATENGLTRMFSFNALNEPLSLTNDSPPIRIYEWDAEQRLVAINQGTHRTEFSYDGLGRRVRMVEKENGGVVSDRHYVWSGTELCEERDAAGSGILKRFSHFGVQAVGSADLPAGNYFYTKDHLSSVRDFTDSSGQSRAVYDYALYGNRSRTSGDLNSDFGFAGLFLHSPSGLYLATYRTYDAGLMRWTSRDPLGESAGNNLFAYAMGDPVNLTDPLGLFGTGGHNSLIDRAFDASVSPTFPNLKLSSHERDILKEASVRVDADQSPDGSYKHAMRNPDQTESQAFSLYSQFVTDRREKAVCLEKAGMHDMALQVLGEGLHSIMDKGSPMHAGFQEWPGIGDVINDVTHWLGEHGKEEGAIDTVLEMQSYVLDFQAEAKK